MNILDIQNYTLNSNLITKKIDNIMMIYNKGNGDMYEINDVGGDILSCLQKHLSFKEILNYLLETYDVPREMAIEEMEEFLSRLIELGVLLI